LSTLRWADLVKINEDELEFLTGSRELAAAKELRIRHSLSILLVTLGADGAHFITDRGAGTVQGFQTKYVEATGAGDGFTAGIISGILPHTRKATDRQLALGNISVENWGRIVQRANAIGALACTKVGAITALPTAEEVVAFLQAT
jgi:fructokinase